MDSDPPDEKSAVSVAQFQPVKGSRIAYDFIGAITGCGIIGWLIDRFCGTKPWALVVMVVVGFAVGVFGAWRSLSQPPSE